MATQYPIQLKRIATQRAASLDFTLRPLPQLSETLKLRLNQLGLSEFVTVFAALDEWRRETEGQIREITTPLREDIESDPGELPSA